MKIENLTFSAAGDARVILRAKRLYHDDADGTDRADVPRRPLAIVTHCYPPAGCTMDHPVVHALSKAVMASGGDVLRFNFRGAGGSTGTFDHGRAERADVEGAVAFARARGYARLALVGFSFGSYVNLHALPRLDQEIAAYVALGFPTEHASAERDSPNGLPPFAIPSLWVTGERDEHSSLDAIAATVPFATKPQMHEVPGADHFLGDRDARARAVGVVTEFLAAVFADSA